MAINSNENIIPSSEIIDSGAGVVNTKSANFVQASNQFLSITDAAQTGLDLSGSFSVEVWLKPVDINNITLIDKWLATGNQRSYKISYTAGNWIIEISDTGAATTQLLLSDSSFSTGSWQHYAITFNSSTSEVIVYRNGSNLVSGTHSVSSVFNSAADVLMFGVSGGTGGYNGISDEYIIWNDLRTPSEILSSYNNGNGRIYTGNNQGMVGYWRYEDNFLDKTANANDLTNNNSVTFSTDVPFLV